MNCYFCQILCELTKQDKFGERWICQKHPFIVYHEVPYAYHPAGDCPSDSCCPQKYLSSVSIAFKYKNNHYLMVWLIQDKVLRLDQTHYDGTWKCTITEPVIYLKPIPANLTPDNIMDKLPTILTFS